MARLVKILSPYFLLGTIHAIDGSIFDSQMSNKAKEKETKTVRTDNTSKCKPFPISSKYYQKVRTT